MSRVCPQKPRSQDPRPQDPRQQDLIPQDFRPQDPILAETKHNASDVSNFSVAQKVKRDRNENENFVVNTNEITLNSNEEVDESPKIIETFKESDMKLPSKYYTHVDKVCEHYEQRIDLELTKQNSGDFVKNDPSNMTNIPDCVSNGRTSSLMKSGVEMNPTKASGQTATKAPTSNGQTGTVTNVRDSTSRRYAGHLMCWSVDWVSLVIYLTAMVICCFAWLGTELYSHEDKLC